jgi:hypothetical protein
MSRSSQNDLEREEITQRKPASGFKDRDAPSHSGEKLFEDSVNPVEGANC